MTSDWLHKTLLQMTLHLHQNSFPPGSESNHQTEISNSNYGATQLQLHPIFWRVCYKYDEAILKLIINNREICISINITVTAIFIKKIFLNLSHHGYSARVLPDQHSVQDWAMLWAPAHRAAPHITTGHHGTLGDRGDIQPEHSLLSLSSHFVGNNNHGEDVD